MKKLFIYFLCIVLSITSLSPVVTEAAQITDVKTSDSKYTAINWAIDNKIIPTNSGNKFSPNTFVTEYQLLQSIAKLDPNYYSSSYSSEEVYDYYSDIYLPLKGTNNRASRNANVTRGQFAKIISALNGMDLSNVQAVQYLYVNEISTGTSGKKTYEDFKPFNDLTRGELAVFLYRIDKNDLVSYEGLSKSSTGKDNGKVTLPPNFENSGTVALKPPSNSGGDVGTPPSNMGGTAPINETIKITTDEEFIANGMDSSLVTIELKDLYGNKIPYEETLTFKVSSQQGAILDVKPNSSKFGSKIIVSDGGEVNFYVTAPRRSNAVTDFITLELQNNNNPKYSHIQKISVPLTYVPKPEVRIEYEVYDPAQPDWTWGAIGEVPEQEIIKPLPPLPGISTGVIYINTLNSGNKTFNALSVTDNKPITVQYQNANFLLENQKISEWLFEQILASQVELSVYYSLNSENRTTYDIRGNYLFYWYSLQVRDRWPYPGQLSEEQISVPYLVRFLPNVENLTINNYESVKDIYSIYSSLTTDERNAIANAGFTNDITKLIQANTKVEELKAAQPQPQNPVPPVNPNAKPYTNIFVTLVAPGGNVVTDYTGTALVNFNGETREVYFTRGEATVKYDAIVYGEAEVSVQLLRSTADSRHATTFSQFLDKTIEVTIFTNPPFNPNKCEREVEVGFVVDQSGSMTRVDPENYTAPKTRQLIKQMKEEKNIAVRFNREGALEAKGPFGEVIAKKPPIYESNTIGGGTNISKGLNKAYIDFTSDSNLPRHVVLLSDGKSSPSQLIQIIKDAKDENVTIHTVLVGKQDKSSIILMQQISSDTGGQFFYIDDILDLHSAYQAILDAILCGTTVSTDFCPIDDAFEEAIVEVRYPDLMMNATINPVCSSIEKVVVRFTSKDGQYQYDLISRGQGVFRANHPAEKHRTYGLYFEAEFLAYDEKGNIVGRETVQPRTPL